MKVTQHAVRTYASHAYNDPSFVNKALGSPIIIEPINLDDSGVPARIEVWLGEVPQWLGEAQKNRQDSKEGTPMRQRRQFSAEFKARVVLEVLSGQKRAAEVCREHQLKPDLLSRWKADFVT